MKESDKYYTIEHFCRGKCIIRCPGGGHIQDRDPFDPRAKDQVYDYYEAEDLVSDLNRDIDLTYEEE